MNDNTALLVIDMQLCAFDGKLFPPVHEGENLLDEVRRLISTARRSAIPVVFVQHCASLEGQPFARGTHGWEIHPSIAPEPGEPVVFKVQSSGFVDTDLQDVLAEIAAETVIVCGIQSEHCVTNTSISALELGLEVVVAKNAHGTFSTEECSASEIIERQNDLLSARGARIQTIASLVGLFASK